MISDSKFSKAAKKTLQERLSQSTSLDSKGYVNSLEQNLLPGVLIQHFESDLKAGDGNELQMKFCAAYSSAALPVNCFAWFRESNRLRFLNVLVEANAEELRFERKCEIFPGRRSPNFDVWIEYKQCNIAIESKLTEYFTKTKPEFSRSYEKLTPPKLAEECWWSVYQEAKEGDASYLDRAQLVKHYFGLRRYQQKQNGAKKIKLLYLYWEPTNADAISVCRSHRSEIAKLKESVLESEIRFETMSYAELWQRWQQVPEIREHAANLESRYNVAIDLNRLDR